jgi:chromosome segregation ATPase
MYPVMELQEAHDALIANMPSGVEHDTASCPFCSALDDGEGSVSSTIIDIEGGDIVSTYTKEELDAAVTAAIAPLQAELSELRSTQEAVEVTARIEELNVQHAAEIADLQAKIDSAVLEAKASADQLEELVAMLEGAKSEQEAAALFAAVREERVAQVKEATSFPEDHIESNADRWAALEQENFDSLVSDWKAIMSSKKEEIVPVTEDALSTETAMTAAHDSSDVQSKSSVRREVMEFSMRGIDPRTIH